MVLFFVFWCLLNLFFRPVSEIPECPLLLKVEESIEWDNWARNQLISDGAHLLGKFSNLEVLIFWFANAIHWCI